MSILPAPPDLIIFDCDGVLVDSEMIASSVMADTLSGYGLEMTAAECRRRFTGISMASVRKQVEDDLHRTLPDNFEETVRRADTLAFERSLKAISGIETALNTIKVPMCVASSGSPEKIAGSLRITKLDHYFENRTFSATRVRNGKPAPDLFLLAASEMGVPPNRCVVIEDSVQGIIAATRAAMPVLGFAGGSHAKDEPGYGDRLSEAGANIVFHDMTVLPTLLGF